MSKILDALPVLVLAVLSVLFFFSALIAGIVALCTRDRVRYISQNILMICGYVPLICLMVMPLVVKKSADNPFAPVKDIEQSICSCLNLAAAEPYAEAQIPALKTFAQFKYPIVTEKEYLSQAHSELEDLIKLSPKAGHLQADLALVAYAEGEDTCERLEKAKQQHLHGSRLIGTLSDALCAKGTLDATAQEDLKAKILKELPAGWYQDTALLAAYKAAHDTAGVDRITRARELKGIAAAPKMLAVVIMLLSVNAFGAIALLVVLFTGAAKLPNQENFHAKNISFRTIAAALLFAMYLQLVVTLGASIVGHLWMSSADASALNLPVGLISLFCGYLIGLYLFIMRPQAMSVDQILSLNVSYKTFPRLWLYGFSTFCILVFLDAVWYFSTANFFHPTTSNPVSGQLMKLVSSSNWGAAGCSFVAVAVLAPIGEEIVFRALVFGWLRKRLPIAPAVFISGLVFAVFHADPGQIVQLTLAGVLFAWLFERTRSLVPSMVAHASMNSMYVITMLLYATASS